MPSLVTPAARRAAILVLALACCASEPPPAVELILGTTDAAGAGFFPLQGDQPLVPGSQAGFHVWLKYRVRGHVPGTYLVRREARRVSDGRLILRLPYDAPVELGEPDGAGLWELESPLPSFMCPAPIGVTVRDERVRISVWLIDPESMETVAEASGEVVPRCPPASDPQSAFCAQICAG